VWLFLKPRALCEYCEYRGALFVPSTSGAFLFVNPFHKHNEALV